MATIVSSTSSGSHNVNDSKNGSEASQKTSNDRFNAEAAGWDNNPFVHAATGEAYRTLLRVAPELSQPDNDLSVLEIGCGTGVLTMLIAPHVKDVVAVDAAEGMIQVLKSKLLSSSAPTNITPLAILLTDPEDSSLPPAANNNNNTNENDNDKSKSPRRKFDLILSHLVLHHIPTPSVLLPLLVTMYHTLKPSGGRILLTDFQNFGPAAKKFHPRSKLVGVERHGIDVAEMTHLLEQAGFTDVNVRPEWTMQKDVERYEGEFGDKGEGDKSKGEGEMMDFPFLVCEAWRR